MDVLAVDGRMGASGDMLLGTLLDLGADRTVLEPIEDALDVTYQVDTVRKSGIDATSVTVLLNDERSRGDEATDDVATDHDHEHVSDRSQDRPHAEGHGPHRSYPEVIEIVEGMELPDAVIDQAGAIFERLGRAEASVHGTELTETHFHEVGADDAIADVVGVAAMVAELDVDRIVTTPLSTGGGTVEMSHGTYPVPGPAVVEIAADADWSLRGGPVDAELLTPTGAAILAELAEGVEQLPTLAVDETGYGAGGYDLDPHPNVLRTLAGTTTGELAREPISVLETNVDDVTPETLGGLQETLTAAGAKDVTVVPTTMKKSRPGHLVKVIAAPEDEHRVARKLAEETGTLGVRTAGAGHRWIARRRIESTTIELDGERYEIDVKVGSDEDGTVYDVSAEYDDALSIADATDVPVRRVLALAEQAVEDEP